MQVLCNKCSYEFEHYNNVYGTFCPKCNVFIGPDKKANFLVESEKKLDILKDEFLGKLRKKKYGNI